MREMDVPDNGRKSWNEDLAGGLVESGAFSGTIAVTGMRREALIVGRGGEVIVSGGDVASLEEKIERVVAKGARAVISIGICGGLAPDLAVGAVVIGSEVAWNGNRLCTDAHWKTALGLRLPHAITGIVAGADRPLAERTAKQALHRDSGALAVDMESHVAARVAAAYRLPFAVLRVVSDAADHTLPPAALDAIGADGKPKIGSVLRSVVANPAQIPALIRTARDSERALAELLRCLDRLGVAFACPYLG